MASSFEIQVPGTNFILRSNSIYYIHERPDSSAPTEMVKRGLSKMPLRTNGDVITTPFDPVRKIWNTGFYPESKCYDNLKEDVKKATLKIVRDKFLPLILPLVPEGLEEYKESNNAYFDNFDILNNNKYKLLKGNAFNTKDPIAMLALWWALIGEQAAPEGEKGNPKYIDVKFEVVDTYKNTTKEQDDDFHILEASATMLSILKTGTKAEKQHTQNILRFLNYELDLSNKENNKITSQIFTGWLKRGLPGQNAKLFNQAVEKYEGKEGQEYMNIYVMLDDAIRNNKIEIRRKDIHLESRNLGQSKKEAAKVIQDNEDLYVALTKL